LSPSHDFLIRETRRQFLGRSGTGLGLAALSQLLGSGQAAAAPTAPTAPLQAGPHHSARAKHAIYLFQNGAPTHVDLFDYKPELLKRHGKPLPDSYIGGKRFSTMTGKADGKLMLAPVEPFRQHGQSGAWVSDFLPHTGRVADELCFVKSMHTDAVNHAPAISLMLSGAQIPGRPTLGAWLTYGLGSETDN